MVQGLEVFIEEFSEIPMEKMNGKISCCALYCSLLLLSRLKKRRLEKIFMFSRERRHQCMQSSSLQKARALIIVYSSSFVGFCVFTGFSLPERSCLIRPLLLLMSTGRKSLNQEISGSGFPLAAQSMVAVRVRSTTFSCGPMSMVGKP